MGGAIQVSDRVSEVAQGTAFEAFLAAYPEYESTAALDELRHRELSRLDLEGHVYLDYAGGGLYGESQIRRHAELLLGNTLGNPHSTNPTSQRTGELVESTRRRVLGFFNASGDEYEVVFTANASHALKLVGEAYPFEPGDRLLLTFDNHNSVNGIREFDRVRGAETVYLPVVPPEMRVDEDTLDRQLEAARPGRRNLFAYPAQSNFSGVQYPLEWIERARSLGWDVLLDAAAHVPTNRLDLDRYRPDYVALSFYKMFGFPTGVGALIARREALAQLHRPWFAGGTISVASVQADKHFLAPGSAAFEDGTLDYTNIPAVALGLDLIESIGLETIHRRVLCLTGWLIDQLLLLRYGSGLPLVRVYGPTGTEGRGGTVAFNLFDASGQVIDHERVERLANRRKISLRTGCFCNPGAGEAALELSRHEIEGCFNDPERAGAGISYDDFRLCMDGKGTGAVRVSFGLGSNFSDTFTLVQFIQGFLE